MAGQTSQVTVTPTPQLVSFVQDNGDTPQQLITIINTDSLLPIWYGYDQYVSPTTGVIIKAGSQTQLICFDEEQFHLVSSAPVAAVNIANQLVGS